MANARSTVFKSGMEEGRNQTRVALLNELERRLMKDKENRPERGTPEYEWGMQFTREIHQFVQNLELK